MEQIIRQILNIEKKAQQIVEEAGKGKERFADEIAAEKNNLTEDILKKAHEEIAVLQKQSSDSAQKQAEQIQAKAQSAIDAMDQAFLRDGDLWAQTIFKRVTEN